MSKPIHELMDEKSMSRFQWGVISLCFLINMLDGFDVLVMAFTAASVASHWSLSGIQLGYLLSAGLVGMALGSLFIAPWADRFGRRPLIMFCIAVAGSGMVASAYAQSPVQLGALRLLTGLGIGGIVAAWIIPAMGWPSVFLYGGLTTLATLPIMGLWLPESLDFLLGRQPRGALLAVNRLLGKVGLPGINTLPAAGANRAQAARAGVGSLFAPGLLPSTLLIWCAFFLVMLGFYFVMSWTPKLMVSAGLSNQQGITGGVLLNVGGIVGTSLIGLLAARFAFPRLLMIYMLANFCLMYGFVRLLGELNMAFAAALLIGIFVNGCVAGLYALTPSIYRSTQRVTGLGWAIGMGRVGAIVSPLLAGRLIDAQWAPAELFSVFGLAFVLGALAIAALPWAQRRSHRQPQPQGQPQG